MADLVTITQLTNMLKDYYVKTEHDAPMEVAVKMWDEIEKNKKDVDGIAAKAIAKVRRNLGIVTTDYTNSDEPTSGYRGYERATVQPKFIKAKGSFDQQLVLMSKTDTGSFVKELATITEDLDESVKLNLAREIFGDGSGKLAEVTADVTAASPATVYVHTTQYLEIGHPIAIYTSAGVFVEATTVITVEPETNSFTANVANNLESLYYITVGESASISSKGTEFTGLSSMRKDNTYFGINRVNFPVWRPAVLGVGSAVTDRPSGFSEINGAKVVNSLMKRSRIKDANGEMKAYDFLLTDYEAYTNHWSALVANRRYMDNADYKSGVTGLLFDGKQIERDAYCIKDSAAVSRVEVFAGGAPATFTVNTTAGLANGDQVEIYTGNVFVGHGVGVTVNSPTEFTATCTATPVAGDLVYLDNADKTIPTADTAPRVFHNAFFINKDTWQWYVWQDITNYTEQLIGLEFTKVANKTQYEFTLTGMMELFNETPTKNGRYRFSIDPAFDAGMNM